LIQKKGSRIPGVQELRENVGDVERTLKAMIKSLENKHLNPQPLEPFLPTKWEKSRLFKTIYSFEVQAN